MKFAYLLPYAAAAWIGLGSLVVVAEESSPPVTESSELAAVPTQLSEEEAYALWARQFLASITPQTGTISLLDGKVTLNVPEDFYYLSPEDTKKVLEDAWGNPESTPTQGMLFPAAYTPISNGSWGVTIDYSEDGYVSDEDAAKIDYDELLKDMQADALAESESRVAAGFESIALIGWAAQPQYDSLTHKLYWAKELKFGSAENNTLNYNVRALGRQGVLVMNFIADMPQLPEIERARDDVMAMVTFNEGHRYNDFNPDLDKVAAYSIGGLIAGKVLAKTGMLAAGLLLLKKFWFVLLLPILWLKNLFKRKPSV